VAGAGRPCGVPYYPAVVVLRRAGLSVLAQSAADWELLIVDEAGPDAEAVTALVDEVADPRVRSMRNERNLGLAGNWNRWSLIVSVGAVISCG